MSEYKIYNYEQGIEEELVELGTKVASEWTWSYFHSIGTFKNICSQSSFDPELLIYCKKGEKIVGYVMARIGEKSLDSKLSVNKDNFARIFYPRVLSGYEEAAELLMKKILENLKNKDIEIVRTRTSNMRDGSFDFLEKLGFTENHDFRDYKLYYRYDLKKGKIEGTSKDIQNYQEDRDLEECSKWVAKFFVMPKENAKQHIQNVSTRDDLVSHLVIYDKDKLSGYCFAYPNRINKKALATYYIEATNDHYFEQLVRETIKSSLKTHADYFIIDLISSVLKFEELVKSLGFEKVVSWKIYEKKL